MKLIWSPVALQRVDAIAEYIARNRPAAAEQVVRGLIGSVRRLQDYP